MIIYRKTSNIHFGEVGPDHLFFFSFFFFFFSFLPFVLFNQLSELILRQIID